MESLTYDELGWFVKSFASEYFKMCILIENFTYEDYPAYNEGFWFIFKDFMIKRKSFDAKSLLEETYSFLYEKILLRVSDLHCDDTNKESFRDKPASYNDFKEQINLLRELEERN